MDAQSKAWIWVQKLLRSDQFENQRNSKVVLRQTEETQCDNTKRIQVAQNHIQYHAFFTAVELLCGATRPSSFS